MGCMYATYEVIRSNQEEAMDWTRQKLQNTRVSFISNDQYDLDYGHFDLEMDRMESISQVCRTDTGPRSGHETNFEQA